MGLELDRDRNFTPGKLASLAPVLEQVDPEYPIHRLKQRFKYVRP
jgi:hypothetical protein